MPQISKVRIVNFNYNDGKRLIADELYDFASKEKDDALNVLINLANGGGKSVLVQLMMQPIIPKAKVAGRRIESFFNKASDHCFVLIEWLKDNSTEKLLTGIAMAASESSNDEDETSIGKSVKYYTFYTNYSTHKTSFDIANMPLSKKENGKFIPAEFETVRSLAKRSNGVLNYYVADDNPKWQKKLAEYGLIQSEWRMMEKLNSEEGGLSKYFGDFKTSDHLIDRLLIPAIENKLNQTYSKEDNSLSTMLISYAQQYASKQDVIKRKETYEAFSRELSALESKAEELWNSNDAFGKSIDSLFGFSDALADKLNDCKLLHDKYTTDLEQIEKQRIRIEHERASLEFYKAQENFYKALESFTEATNNEHMLSENLRIATHSKLKLECAEYYQKLLCVVGELQAIQGEISRRESGGENGERLADLKYSVYVQINNLLDEDKTELEELYKQQASFDEQKNNCEKQLKISEEQVEMAKEEYTRADEKLRNAKNETEREVLKYGLEFSRSLDLVYNKTEIINFQKAKLDEKTVLQVEYTSTEAEMKNNEDELLSIPKKKAILSQNQSERERERKEKQKMLDEYYVEEENVLGICSEHNLDFSLRFTDSIKEFLLSEQHSNQAKQAEINRNISIVEEEIKSAQRGSLHIPYKVIEYLNSTNVRYSTCEKYLTEQVAEGKIAKDECFEILRNYPAVAFGILMNQEDKERFFDYGREKWLPAMVPLYTYEQMVNILNKNKIVDDAIAFYSEEYFNDIEHFIENLKNNHRKLIAECDCLDGINKKLKCQLESISSFTYTSNYATEQKMALEELTNAISEINLDIQNLELRETELTRKKETIECKKQDISRSIENNRRILESIATILQRIDEEQFLADNVNSTKQAFNEAKHNYAQQQTQLNDIKLHLETIIQKINALDAYIAELKSVKDTIGQCGQANIVNGDWRELYAQYQSVQSSLNQELSSLKLQLVEKNKRKKDYEREIESREINSDEYTTVKFVEEQLHNLRKTEKLLNNELSNATQYTKQVAEQKGKAEGSFESAKQTLLNYGEPLNKSEVVGHFDIRLKELREKNKVVSAQSAQNRKLESKISIIVGRLNDRIRSYNRPEIINKIQLDDLFEEQYDCIINDYEDAKHKLDKAKSQVFSALKEMRNKFANSTCGVTEAISDMLSLLSSESRGDHYYTLLEHINGDIQNTQRAIAQIVTDLKEFENNHKDLVRQCVLQGGRIYEGLVQMESSSRVTVYDGKDKKQMIHFDIPADVDSMVASTNITTEIDKGTNELVEKMLDNTVTEGEIKKIADRVIGSRNLLRKYISKESIRVDAYKIDQNPQNAGYRPWEQTQVKNSGAEKFVIYFSVILSLMNYTRGDLGSIRDKDLQSSLILDNPFGATTSKHILVPMFAIAKHFRVQMICLSDINKSDVINCFDIVIKAIVRKRPMSNYELLTHEGNESIEHGYYRTEQLSLI